MAESTYITEHLEHHFVVVGVKKDDGTIDFVIDDDTTSARFGHEVIWNAESREWSAPRSSADTDLDIEISDELSRRLAAKKQED